MDWSDGQYERTAAMLDRASVKTIDTAKIGPGMRVLDLGTGTGNAALEAARRGAEVIAVEPAARLLEVCRERAAREGLAVTTKAGDASRIPADDASIDVLVSVFAVIFAPDAEVAADQMLRVVRPGGHVVMTSWTPRGPISQAGKILIDAINAAHPPAAPRPAPAWGDPAFVRDLFEKRGARVSIEEATLPFEAASPEAWFEEQAQHHPGWRFGREALKPFPGEWERVRTQSLEALRAGNEDPSRLRVTSHYLVIDAVRGG